MGTRPKASCRPYASFPPNMSPWGGMATCNGCIYIIFLMGPWVQGPRTHWPMGPGPTGPWAHGPWAHGPWAHGPWAHGPSSHGPIKKIMKMHPLRIARPPHGLIFGGNEAYGLQDAFESVPGLPDLKNVPKSSKLTKNLEKSIFAVFWSLFFL